MSEVNEFRVSQLSPEELFRNIERIVKDQLNELSLKTNTERVLSREQAASYLGIGKTKLNEIKKEIGFRRIGKKVIFLESNLINFLKGKGGGND